MSAFLIISLSVALLTAAYAGGLIAKRKLQADYDLLLLQTGHYAGALMVIYNIKGLTAEECRAAASDAIAAAAKETR